MRSEKVRTYNFPQNRCTDHRINASIQDLEGIMEGGEPLEGLVKELMMRHEISAFNVE
jgi:peptide chain release factor 1